MTFEELTPEQQEKAKACKTIEEVLAFAKEEGLELSQDELDAVSGGRGWGKKEPDCQSYGYLLDL